MNDLLQSYQFLLSKSVDDVRMPFVKRLLPALYGVATEITKYIYGRSRVTGLFALWNNKVAWSQSRFFDVISQKSCVIALLDFFYFFCVGAQTLYTLWHTSLAHSIKRKSANIFIVEIALQNICPFKL